MPKIKPNEKCPCMSGIKYKKCCSKKIEDDKHALAEEFITLLQETEEASITSDVLQRINTTVLDRYARPSIDMTPLLTSLNMSKIHGYYKDKRVLLMVERNEMNDSAFSGKGAKRSTEPLAEDIMLIYKNHFLQFHYETEFNDAMKEFGKW